MAGLFDPDAQGYAPEPLSRGFLAKIRTGEAAPDLEALGLARLHPHDIQRLLPDDRYRKATWINLYNGCFQRAAEQGKRAPAIYHAPLLTVAGHSLSLDAIEHGILRRNRWKYGLGYLPRPFPPAHLRALALRQPDPRIHFALNCGAEGCPPIAVYDAAHVEDQLQVATLSFLQSGIRERSTGTRPVLEVSQLFQWFIGDFGGPGGLRKMLSDWTGRDYTQHRLKYFPFDRTLKLRAFVDEEAQ